jgi:hypothetical protein
MDDAQMVTIGRYWEPSQPLFLKSMLEAYGIEAQVAGEYTGNISPFLGVFGGEPHGGIELQVAAADAEAAMELLANPPGSGDVEQAGEA